jgi:mannitol-1-/sugar-/sorbitol-6-/2-deoxyglucose-6-phosphatase
VQIYFEKLSSQINEVNKFFKSLAMAIHKVEAIFFDMDGVLIFSEPYWREAEHKIYKDRYNIELTVEDVNNSTGLKTTEVVQMHSLKYKLNSNAEELGHEIEKEVVKLVLEHGKPMEGLIELAEWIKEQGWRRCLVTSSSQYVYEHIVKFVGLDGFFEKKFTAYDELWGKPNPAVYNSAMDYLNLPKENIIVLEDSMNGVKAAYAAGLNVLGLPEEHNKSNPEYQSMLLKSFNSHVEILEYLKSNFS